MEDLYAALRGALIMGYKDSGYSKLDAAIMMFMIIDMLLLPVAFVSTIISLLLML